MLKNSENLNTVFGAIQGFGPENLFHGQFVHQLPWNSIGRQASCL